VAIQVTDAVAMPTTPSADMISSPVDAEMTAFDGQTTTVVSSTAAHLSFADVC